MGAKNLLARKGLANGGGPVIVAEVSVVPLGVGTSVSAYVTKAVRALDESGLKVMHGPMSTSIEARTVDEIFSAVKKAHDAVIAAGARRVVTTVKLDDRRDKDHSMASKLGALER
jgi:uncharacterized protein (TIGR00106 family)